MKNYYKLIGTTEENFNKTIEGIEKEIATIKVVLTTDYFDENIEPSEIIKSLDESLKRFNDYLIDINVLFTTATFHTLALPNKEDYEFTNIEFFAELLITEISYKNNAYCEIYEKYKEFANAIKETL